jgi:Domain of unknown function (DUF4336)
VFILVSIICASASKQTLPKTWSNRYGSVITPVTTGVWSADRPFVWNKIDVGGRMLIARASDGSLLVHSPIEWTQSLSDELDLLGGGVGHIIAPNYEHLKYTKQWSDKYPSANMYACPGLPARMPDCRFTHEFGSSELDLNDFSKTCDYVWMDCEENPVTGNPFFNEVVFYHIKSKTLFCADAYWNYPSDKKPNFYGVEDTGKLHPCSKAHIEDGELDDLPVPFGTRAWKFGMDQIYLPFYKKFMIRKYQEKYLLAVNKILSWDVQQIAPCHGDLIKGKGICTDALKRHFLL